MQRGFCAGIVLVTSMTPACWASAAQAQALAPGDTRAAEARMVYSYSATQANLLQASDQKIMALHGEVDGLQKALSVSRAELHRLRSQGAREAREAETRIAALEAQLTGVQERAVAELAARDRRYAIEIDRYRGEVASVLETPEGQRAVNEILAGNVSVGAEILDRINAAKDTADEAAAERQVGIAKAKRARQAADLLFDRAPTGEMIKRYEHIVALDEGIDWDWLRLADLRSMAGYHESAIAAARTAVERAVDEAARQRTVLSLALILSRGDRIGEAVTVLETALVAAGVASNGTANASALEFAVEARLLAADLLADRNPARAAELTQAALGELDVLLATASREEAARLGSAMSPYSEKFSCKNDDHGQCIHPEKAYEDAAQGVASRSDPAVTNDRKLLRQNGRPHLAAAKRGRNGSADAYGTYRDSVYRELQGLIEAPETPMLRPVQAVRTLILPYADRNRPDRLYMPRFVYSVL